MKIHPVGAALFYVETRTGLMCLIVVFSNCLAKAPKCGN